MGGNDDKPVTFVDLEKWCAEKRENCALLRKAEAVAAAATNDSERRVGMSELEQSVARLAQEVAAVKELLSGKVFVLAKPVLYLLVCGGVGIGLAGRAFFDAVLPKLWGGP